MEGQVHQKKSETKEQKQKSPNVDQEAQQKKKKTIIVVGKMGHGKSSFVKMFVSDQDKQRIEVSSSIKSTTKTCQLYQMSNLIKAKLDFPKQEQIYLMDTPGLNSNAKNYIIMEQIRYLSFLQKCQIISIIYIRISNDYRQQEVNSSIDMYRVLPIPMKNKEKISMFVFTFWDYTIETPKKFNNFYDELDKNYKKKGVNFLKSKNIKWMNFSEDSEEQIQYFQNKMENQKYKLSYDNQWQQLNKMLKEGMDNKYTLEELNERNKRFTQIYRQKLQHYISIQKQTMKDEIQFVINVENSQSFQIKPFDIFVLTAVLIFPISLALLNSYFIFDVGRRVFNNLKFKNLNSKRLAQTISNFLKEKEKQQSLAQLEEEQLEKISIGHIKSYFIKKLNIHSPQQNQIAFQYQSPIQDVKIFRFWVQKKVEKSSKTQKQQKKSEQIKYNTTKQGKKTYGAFKIKSNSQYQFLIAVRRPSEKEITEIIKQTAMQLYGNEQS